VPSSETSDDDIVRAIREAIGISDQRYPDAQIIAGVRGFAREFHYWYDRVLTRAVPKYRSLIVDRINPLVRGMEFDGMGAHEVSTRLVQDYARRNFVTAGGWALEQLAIAGSPTLTKSAAAGIDAEKHEMLSAPVTTLYVSKAARSRATATFSNSSSSTGRKRRNACCKPTSGQSSRSCTPS
jgi:hypothetical protein